MKQKDIIIYAALTFFVVVAWIVFNFYHSATTSTISSATSMQIQPIEPRFDQRAIEQLKKRPAIKPQYTLPTNASASATPSPTLLPSPIITPLISPTQSASISGSITP